MGHYMNEVTRFFWQHDIYFRIVVSAILGFIIGWDRTSKNKPAGLKTYTYVSVACTLITIVSIEGAEMLSQPGSGKMMDPFRLAAQIVSGLGFLGAGVILKDGLRVKGLTSAAMIFYVGGNRNRHWSRILFHRHLRYNGNLHHYEDRKYL